MGWECVWGTPISDIGDFDIAFAYEALARAHAVAGDAVECEQNLARAQEAGEGIKKEDDKQYFFGEFTTVHFPLEQASEKLQG